MHQPCRVGLVFVSLVQMAWVLVARWFLPFQTWEGLLWQHAFFDCDEPERTVLPAANLSGLEMVHVAYATEPRFFPNLLLSMVSLSRSLQDPGQCTIHVVLYDGDVESAGSLIDCFTRCLELLPATPTVRVHRYEFDPLMLKVSRYSRYRNHHVTAKPITWARLRFEEYLPSVRRVLYLDTDTIVKSDVGALYRMHMNYPLAAALDSLIERSNAVPDIIADMSANNNISRINIKYENYFCTGVMLMDLERWRAERLGVHIDRWALRIPSREPLRANWHDQDMLNLAFQGRVDLLDWRWNAMGMGLENYVPAHCVDGARILHFTPQPATWQTDWWWLRSWGGLRFKPHTDPLRSCPDLQ